MTTPGEIPFPQNEDEAIALLMKMHDIGEPPFERPTVIAGDVLSHVAILEYVHFKSIPPEGLVQNGRRLSNVVMSVVHAHGTPRAGEGSMHVQPNELEPCTCGAAFDPPTHSDMMQARLRFVRSRGQ